MPDQLSLELPSRAPRLPRTLRPMLPRPAAAAFDSTDHLFEPSWGGRRALAFVEPDPETGAIGLQLIDPAGRDLAPLVPELGLADALASPFVVLDGEIIAPDESGRSNARMLARRLDAAGRGDVAGPGAGAGHEAPVVYLAFDLLYLDGRPLLAQPLVRRRELLAKTVTRGPGILVVPAIRGDGLALLDAAAAQGLPGILARHARGPYLSGRVSRLWLSVAASLAPARAEGAAASGPVVPPEDVEPYGGGRRPLLALIRKLPLPFEGG